MAAAKTAVPPWREHALSVLRTHGHGAGGARAAIVDLLGEQNCCVSAQEIFDELRGSGRRVGIASVYRVLDVLASLQLVQRVDVGGGVSRYEPVQPGGEHHHHLVCGECGRVVAFEDAGLERALARLGDRLGYGIAAHEVVLHGSCERCRSRAH
jgi:Fur family ferric uptake transcriptional regulator